MRVEKSRANPMVHDAVFTTMVDIRGKEVSIHLSPEFESDEHTDEELLQFFGTAEPSLSIWNRRSNRSGYLTSVAIRWDQPSSTDRVCATPEGWVDAVSSGDENRVGSSFALRMVASQNDGSFKIAWGEEIGQIQESSAASPLGDDDLDATIGPTGIHFGRGHGALPRIAVEIAAHRAEGIYGILALPTVRNGLESHGVYVDRLSPHSAEAAIECAISALVELNIDHGDPVTWYAGGLGAMLELSYYRI